MAEPPAKRGKVEEEGAAGGISDADALDTFSKFLAFPTVSSSGHLDGANVAAVDFLATLCKRAGLEVTVLPGPEPGPKPVLVAKWSAAADADRSLGVLLLNSHYDVVPVMDEHWTKPAFEGLRTEVDGESRVYGRGAQDMKPVCIQYIVAISRLAAAGVVPRRDVYLSFVPDEETGGSGIAYFLDCDFYNSHLKDKIVCALDEGLANTEDAYSVFYGERTPWWVLVEANGPTGHGSRFIKGTATHALQGFTHRALAFRKEQQAKLWAPHPAGHGGCDHAKSHKLGDVTTVNLTMQRAGVTTDGGKTFAINVIPVQASAGFDIRVTPGMKHADMCELLTKWCREAEKEWDAAEGTLKWSFAEYGGEALQAHHTTSTDPEANPFWKAMHGVLSASAAAVESLIFPAATDSRFLRALQIPCFGFSPMKQCPVLLHEHDEYLPEDTFTNGTKVYEKLIPALLAA